MTNPPKVLQQINRCGECPHYGYYSGNVYHCRLVHEAVHDQTAVAPFCPLPDYPSRIIAGMERTIRGLRAPYEYGFGLALLTHVATKLKLNLEPNGSGITIPFQEKGERHEIYLGLDDICEIKVWPCEITFLFRDRTFKILPDGERPFLQEAVDLKRDAWRHYHLGT